MEEVFSIQEHQPTKCDVFLTSVIILSSARLLKSICPSLSSRKTRHVACSADQSPSVDRNVKTSDDSTSRGIIRNRSEPLLASFPGISAGAIIEGNQIRKGNFRAQEG